MVKVISLNISYNGTSRTKFIFSLGQENCDNSATAHDISRDDISSTKSQCHMA